MLQVIINITSRNGKGDIEGFRRSLEYQYLNDRFESSFLSIRCLKSINLHKNYIMNMKFIIDVMGF